ncbi:DNA cytosine methyltransferase [Polaribacter porphyrae]|uniref:Cytosine-specific methyltransferase n=1 Tax=Polaribacter porphyrae TaxID=1137780 RepID=A0A2S7WRS2_9FLAO|nr:DNA cytosine methyltransferase [Polaribacter porphyrae]PQJ80166.1 DNA (cytosine-5-)-methyltransferase [Polaribacter porphyrae]
MNTIDLFSGCGGVSLGFKWAGFNAVLASDIDENCEKTFTANFPETPFICGDLSDIKKEDFDKHINKEIDVVIGGPPCQGFSLANKKRNKVADDPRNKLFYEFVKVIDWYNPKSFVMENVKGLLSMKSGQVIKQIIAEFENAGEYGYEVKYEVLKASDFGVPQARQRVIVIGIRKDLKVLPEFPKKKYEKEITVNEAISDLPTIHASEGKPIQQYTKKVKNGYQEFMRKNSNNVKNHVAMRHTQRLINRFKAIKNGQGLLDVWETHGAVQRGNPGKKSTVKFSQNNQRLHGDKPAPTIAASFQSNFIHPKLDRNFTAREGARLQSFPDDFEFKGMRTKMSWEKGLSQYQQIGNAVPPLLAYEIALTLKRVLEKGNVVDESKAINADVFHQPEII